jgi:nucleoid-associated protein YgaU
MPGRVRKIKTRVLDRKRYYTTIKYPEIPLSVDDFYVITTIGDRLDNLANQFYEDVNLWWVITSANPDVIKRDSFMLEPGIEIRIPANLQTILENFNELNK